MAKGGKMNTSKAPTGKKATVPNWSKAVSPSNNFMKAKPGVSGTGVARKGK